MPERNIFSFKINTNSINKRSANLMFNTANPMVNNQTCNINYSQCRTIKGVFKGGVQGVQTPPEIFRFFLKSEGKEIESKRKKGMLGVGGLPFNIFLGLIFF